MNMMDCGTVPRHKLLWALPCFLAQAATTLSIDSLPPSRPPRAAAQVDARGINSSRRQPSKRQISAAATDGTGRGGGRAQRLKG